MNVRKLLWDFDEYLADHPLYTLTMLVLFIAFLVSDYFLWGFVI